MYKIIPNLVIFFSPGFSKHARRTADQRFQSGPYFTSWCLAGVLRTDNVSFVSGHPLANSCLMILFTNTMLPLHSNDTAEHKVMQQAAEHITFSSF